jgi:CHRD domain
MGRRFAVFIAALAVALAVAVPATAGAAPAPAVNGGRPLSTTLTGATEVPGPGDSNASGQATVWLNQGQGRVCFDLSWANVEGTVTMGHIHVGAAGASGGVVVPLFSGSYAGTDSASGCVQEVEPSLIKAIRMDPSDYYVNLHSTEFPGGALRGQLSK